MTPTQRTGGQLLAAQLAAEGAADVFAVPGVQLDWAIDPLADAGVRLVVPRHEQATSYMADGYARTTGRPGVCMVVPGPGVSTACAPHNSDYAPQDWVISLTELLRVIQFYNSLGYNYCPGTGSEDDFCPGLV